MYCTQCGFKLDASALFCSQCGNRVKRETVSDKIDEESILSKSIIENDIVSTMADHASIDNITDDTSDIQPADLPQEDMDSQIEDANELAEEELISEDTLEEVRVDDTFNEPQEDDLSEDVSSFSNCEQTDNAASFDDDNVNSTGCSNQEEPEQAQETQQPSKIPSVVVEQKIRVPQKQKRSAGAHILTTVLCLLLSVFLLATIAIFVAKTALDSETITNMLANIELADIKVDDLADKDELIEMGLRVESDNVMNIIYDNINQDALADPLTKREFEKIINNKAFSEYIGELLGKRMEKLSKGKSTDIITISDICNFLEDEKREIANIIGYEITETRISNLRKNLENNYGDVFESLEDKTLNDLVGKTASGALMVVFSDWLLVVLIVLDVLFLCLIFLAIRSVKFGCNYAGVTLTVIGTLSTIFALMVLFGFLSLFISGILAEIITQSVSVILWDLIIISVSILFVGVVIIFSGKIINKILSKRAL